ncbi:hypothetical protein C7410_10410 [Paraburkholderia silvatlantica]|uniref:Uncharacterized protein n=1 Tax=Paraburkholderia silvatlantica TaxID=321895 RepID=A0A2V4U4I5_9BURK|nr:hypothetical protein C7410_10410 [Paraburkholderia silvatlantica]
MISVPLALPGSARHRSDSSNRRRSGKFRHVGGIIRRGLFSTVATVCIAERIRAQHSRERLRVARCFAIGLPFQSELCVDGARNRRRLRRTLWVPLCPALPHHLEETACTSDGAVDTRAAGRPHRIGIAVRCCTGSMRRRLSAVSCYGEDANACPLRVSDCRVIVLGVGFLPASAVIAGANLWQLGHLADQAQVVPKLLARAIDSSAQVMSLPVTCLLIITALGSACSILLAMTDATATVSRSSPVPAVFHRVLPVLVATLIAVHGQSIVNVMVTFNIVYPPQ